MLSVSSVRSAKGAAGYFAADNYYTAGEAETAGEWIGNGAALLGLEGKVEQAIFEALLEGTLPDGTRVGVAGRHRAGVDLTFSLPKSWSLIALVGGDRRIVDAYRAAVKDTIAWVERNAAAARVEIRGRETLLPTGNLVAALFEHDTSRALDPQSHLHAVVANVTQTPDGNWHALRNDKLWSLNTLLNSITMSGFRERAEALGYRTADRSKHGNFEAEGVARNIVMAFSQRRIQILAKVAEMRVRTPEAFAAATLMTRDKKAPHVDRGALVATWRESAREVGLDLSAVIGQADARGQAEPTPWSRLRDAAGSAIDNGRAMISVLGERLGLTSTDRYLPKALHKQTSEAIAGAHAVASALRHLEQREAAFSRTDIYKAALDTGLPVGIAAIEARVAALERARLLVPGGAQRETVVTTAHALVTERALLDEVERGRGNGLAFMPRKPAVERLQQMADERSGLTLNTGQATAGALLLASPDRIVAVQGVAGAGKSSMLAPTAALIEAGGQRVLGLAVQNTLVQMLQRETGIASMTVARFVKQHEKLLADRPDLVALHSARNEWRGAAIFVDESSMLSNSEALKLARLANRLEVGRMAFVGDARQLGAVDAGKPFSVMQQAGVATAHMPTNLRAQGQAIREAATAAQIGNVDRALAALAEHTIEAPARGAAEAAERWLALAPEMRARTAIYAAGRRLRTDVNQVVQQGRLARGELGSERLSLAVLDQVSVTDEELRYAHAYAPGMVVEIGRPQRGQRLPRARATVEGVDQGKGIVSLRLSGGRIRALRPARLRSPQGQAPLQIYERKALDIHASDRIRWTANDPKRGLLNADQATVLKIEQGAVTVETSLGLRVTLPKGDPMLNRLDLAYALNAHMAQGLTSEYGIAVMETRDTKLVNQQTFLVTVTRLRAGLTLIVDRADQLARQLARNPGGKSSALESTGAIRDLAKSPGADPSARQPLQKTPEDGGGKSKLLDFGL